MKQTESPAIRAIQEIKKAVIGKDDCIIKAMTAILAGGHILIEDVPGVGKTTLALAFSKALHLEQNRIQFTPAAGRCDRIFLISESNRYICVSAGSCYVQSASGG